MWHWIASLQWGTVISWIAMLISLASVLYARATNKRSKRAEQDRTEAKWIVDTFNPANNLHAVLRFRNNSNQVLEHVWISHDQFRNPDGIAITSLPDGYMVGPNQWVELVIDDRRDILKLPDVLQISWTTLRTPRHIAAHRLAHLKAGPLVAEDVHFDNLLMMPAKRDILDMMNDPHVEHIPKNGGMSSK